MAASPLNATSSSTLHFFNACNAPLSDAVLSLKSSLNFKFKKMSCITLYDALLFSLGADSFEDQIQTP